MVTQSIDTVRICIPRDGGFAAVAGLVVGGVAARHEVTLDVLEDLQLALDTLLHRVEAEQGEVTVELRVAGRAIDVALGPIDDDTVAELERGPGEALGLRRLLDTTVDDMSLTTRNGESWVELRKGYALAGADG